MGAVQPLAQYSPFATSFLLALLAVYAMQKASYGRIPYFVYVLGGILISLLAISSLWVWQTAKPNFTHDQMLVVGVILIITLIMLFFTWKPVREIVSKILNSAPKEKFDHLNSDPNAEFIIIMKEMIEAAEKKIERLQENMRHIEQIGAEQKKQYGLPSEEIMIIHTKHQLEINDTRILIEDLMKKAGLVQVVSLTSFPVKSTEIKARAPLPIQLQKSGSLPNGSNG